MSKHRNAAQTRLISALSIVVNRARHEDDVTDVDILGCLDGVKVNFMQEMMARPDSPEDDDGEGWKKAHGVSD